MTDNKTDIKEQIFRLQENLRSIRMIAGWTTEELGNKIGVTKQTISNIENHKVKLTQTQYIAIRAVLDYEVRENPKNVVLAQVIPILLDYEDDSKKDEIKEAVETIAATASGGIKGEQLSTVSNALLNPLIGAGNMIGSAFGSVVEGVKGTLSWLAPTRHKKVKKEKTKK